MAVKFQAYISYECGCVAAADTICAGLESNGIACWLYHRDHIPGAKDAEELRAVINDCQVAVAIIYDFLAKEAFIRSVLIPASKANKPIVAINLGYADPDRDIQKYIESSHILNAYDMPLAEAVAILSKNVRDTLELSDRTPQANRQPHSTDVIESQSAATHQVYVSYASGNDDVADAVVSELESNGVGCWIFHRDHILGVEKERRGVISNCQVVVLILSKSTSPKETIEFVLIPAAEMHKPILTMLIDDFQLEPDLLRYLRGIPLLDALGMRISEAATILSKNVLETLELSGRSARTDRQPGSADVIGPQRLTRHQAYICYSYEDAAIAETVCAALESNGIACWIHLRDHILGASSSEERLAAIADCEIVVIILSHHGYPESFIKWDLTPASEANKPIIPLTIDYFRPGPELRPYLGGIHWIDASNMPLSKAIAIIVKKARETLEISGSAPQAKFSPRPADATETQKEKTIQSQHYDVFISYRRDMDAQTARLIRSELQKRTFRVFLDVDDLRPGHFDQALLEKIEAAPSFLLILSKGSLERCADPNDWLRREIVCALTKKKKIIPIMMPGFGMPAQESMPQELWSIRVHQGVSYSHDFFEAMIQKIVDYLGKPEIAS